MQDETAPIADLIHRARAGDHEALQILLGRYREFVRLLIRQRSGGQLQARVDSSDIIQETLLRVAQNIQHFQGSYEEEWRAWLARIAEREVVHQLRHHLGAAKRDLTREQPLPRALPSSANGQSRLEQWSARPLSSPSQAAMRKERAQFLANALARLPDDYREVLILRHLDGLEFTAVAERLGRSCGAVRVLWTRALKKLREELSQETSLDSDGSHV